MDNKIISSTQLIEIKEQAKNKAIVKEYNDLNNSLIQLTQKVAEHHEVSQLKNVDYQEEEKYDELNESLSLLNQSLVTSKKAEKIINHAMAVNELSQLMDVDSLDDNDEEEESLFDRQASKLASDAVDEFSQNDFQKMDTLDLDNTQIDTPNDLIEPIQDKVKKQEFTGFNLSSVNRIVFRPDVDEFRDKLKNDRLVHKEVETINQQTQNIAREKAQTKASTGFNFASGKKVILNAAVVDEFRNKFGNDSLVHEEVQANDQEILKKIVKNVQTGALTGFNFASGKRVILNPAVVDEFRNKFENEKDETTEATDQQIEENKKDNVEIKVSEVKSFTGFNLASGKNINLNTASVNKFKEIFEKDTMEVDNEEQIADCQIEVNKENTKRKFEEIQELSVEGNVTKKPKRTVSSPNLNIRSFRNVSKIKRSEDISFDFDTPEKSVLQEQQKQQGNDIKTEDKSTPSRTSTVFNAKKLLQSSFAPSFSSSPFVNASKLRKKKLEFNNELVDHNSTLKNDSISNDLMDKENVNDLKCSTSKTPFRRNFKLQNNDDINAAVFSPIPSSSSDANSIKTWPKNNCDEFATPQSSKGKRKLNRRKSELNLSGIKEKIEVDDFTHSDVFHLCIFEDTFNVRDDLKQKRKIAFEEQSTYIENKPSEDKRPMTGTLFMMKQSKNRQSIYEHFKVDKLLEKRIHSTPFDDSIYYIFTNSIHYNLFNNTIFLTFGDNVKCILDSYSCITYKQIKNGFLSSLGVDASLLHEKWFENAYKMIFYKLAQMENAFANVNKFDVLTIENILLQLKYRYDREIDRAERPALRKICEKDEQPLRRIVLKVMNINYCLEDGYELELSDGWYKLKAIVDACMAEALARAKISIGSKLLITNMELFNVYSGFHPLDAPDSVRLKIHGNSTRLANINSKLGFTKNPSPFRVSLNSISPNGGKIGHIRVVVVHVYSNLFVEIRDNKKGWFKSKI
jgi:hypothetical protein